MKVKHLFIFSCYAIYFSVLFVIFYFEIDAGMDAGIMLGLIGVLFILHILSVILQWLSKNWEKPLISKKK